MAQFLRKNNEIQLDPNFRFRHQKHIIAETERINFLVNKREQIKMAPFSSKNREIQLDQNFRFRSQKDLISDYEIKELRTLKG